MPRLRDPIKPDELAQFRKDLRAMLELEKVLTKIARVADARIAATAIGSYMVLGPPTTAPNTGDKLRIQSGRLSRAVKGDIDRESLTAITFDGATLDYVRIIDVPYAAIHEFGGEIVVPISAKMRRFFWAKYKETADDKWFYMAITKKRQFNIKIRPRPYLRPAIDAERGRIGAFAGKLFDAFATVTLKAE